MRRENGYQHPGCGHCATWQELQDMLTTWHGVPQGWKYPFSLSFHVTISELPLLAKPNWKPAERERCEWTLWLLFQHEGWAWGAKERAWQSHFPLTGLGEPRELVCLRPTRESHCLLRHEALGGQSFTWLIMAFLDSPHKYLSRVIEDSDRRLFT